MEKVKKVILIFESVHYTLQAETCLNSRQWSFMVIPIPPAVSKGCGLGIQVNLTDQQDVEDYLIQFGNAPLKSVEI